jgi:hypothetical protein
VVILDEMVRQQGANPENVIFRELLLRLRDGCTTKEDYWATILTRTPANASNTAEFILMLCICFTQERVYPNLMWRN